LPDKRKMSIR
jgi:phosphatidylinositol kinase/protein kinase (PI-3  family)